jgi:LruC domain-containing protein
VERALLTIDPVALGGVHENGLGVQLPAAASKTGVWVRRRIRTGEVGGSPVYGDWEDLQLTGDTNFTVRLSSNLRELFALEAGQLNVGVAGKDDRAGQRLEVEFNWPVGADLDVSEAPFDLFIFRTQSVSHEIHFPRYGGTVAMDGTLFAQAGSANGAGKWYVNDRGIPAALNLKTASGYPTEATRIEVVFPDILSFAALPSFTAWSGQGNDPRTFYLRPSATTARKLRGTPSSRPEPPSISRLSCSEGLPVGRVGRRVRAGATCVVAGCPTGFTVVAGQCTPITQGLSFTTVGTHTWVVPAGVTSVKVWVVGGGGGAGGGWSPLNSGGGGGGGGYAHHAAFAVTPGASLSVVVGAGGGGGGAEVAGSNGGDSSFAGTVVGRGGGGGRGGHSYHPLQGTGGTASGGQTNLAGGDGNGFAGSGSGNPYAGAGGRGSCNTSNCWCGLAGGGAGGGGLGGGAGTGTGVGEAGASYGGGGGGGRGGCNSGQIGGGSGAQGIVRLEWTL